MPLAFSCSLAGLILISTVVCFLLPPFRYHLTLTHISLSLLPTSVISQAVRWLALILISTVVCFPHPPSPLIMLILLYWSFFLYSTPCSALTFLFLSFFTVSPFSLHVYFVLYPLTLVHGDTAVESADCADPGVVACFQIPLSNRSISY